MRFRHICVVFNYSVARVDILAIQGEFRVRSVEGRMEGFGSRDFRVFLLLSAHFHLYTFLKFPINLSQFASVEKQCQFLICAISGAA